MNIKKTCNNTGVLWKDILLNCSKFELHYVKMLGFGQLLRWHQFCFCFLSINLGMERVENRVKSLHMSGISKIQATLVCSFVGSILQTDNSLASFKFVFTEVTYIFFRFFWTNAWNAELTSLYITWIVCLVNSLWITQINFMYE